MTAFNWTLSYPLTLSPAWSGMSYAKSKWPYLGLSNKEQRLIQSKIHHPKSQILTVDFGFWITPGWKLGSDLDVSKVQKNTRQFGAGCSVLPWSIKFSGNRFRFPKISILVFFAGNWRRETASKKTMYCVIYVVVLRCYVETSWCPWLQVCKNPIIWV